MSAVPVMIEGDLYAQAQKKAAALQTSVPDIVAEYLKDWVAGEDQRSAAREVMRRRFASPDWRFAVGNLEGREERNARR
jgi:hypothetical protein